MAKYAQATARQKATSPIRTTGKRMSTYNSGQGFARDAKSDLFLLAVTNMGSEQTFYESAAGRDSRFASLVHQVAREDLGWIAGFLPFLRNTMNMRSASIILAAEALHATGGGDGAAELVASALVRGDEPAEIIGYWQSRYGRSLPRALKRGIALAMNQFDAYDVMKYDSGAIRYGDILQLAHVKPANEEQSALYKFALDRRYGAVKDAYGIAKLDAAIRIGKMSASEIRSLTSEELREAGMTWERYSSYGAMDAAAWERVIPSMGYMALLRNLRNFEQAGVSRSVLRDVANLLADPDRVAKSRQFPYRFLSAYKALDSDTFRAALSDALDASTQNLPVFQGDTLVLTDLSGSMDARVSARTTVERWEIGALFAAALAKKNHGSVNFWGFGSTWREAVVSPTASVLATARDIKKLNVGHSTNLWQAFRAGYNGHRRVVVFTDEQSNRMYGLDQFKDALRKNGVNSYFFNLAGYAPAAAEFGKDGFYELGGFTDATFKMIPLLERGRGEVKWPWED